MSFQSTGWVIDHSPTTGTDRLVLLALANYGAKDPITQGDGRYYWEAWPSVERIAFEAGLVKVDSARKALQRLADAGHIQTVPNGCPDERYPANKRPNLYRILTDNPRRCWGDGCALCDPPRGVGDPPPGGPVDLPPRETVTPHGEGAKQVLDQVQEQPIEQGGHGADAPMTAPARKERNHAALAKLPKSVDPEDVKALCLHLCERSNRHHGVPGFVKVSPNWVTEMGRLLNSGPKDVDGYVPTPVEVREVIDGIFDRLTDRAPGTGFCWADTVQSPGNLRVKWVRITRDLARLQPKATQEGMLAIMRQLDEMGVPRV